MTIKSLKLIEKINKYLDEKEDKSGNKKKKKEKNKKPDDKFYKDLFKHWDVDINSKDKK